MGPKRSTGPSAPPTSREANHGAAEVPGEADDHRWLAWWAQVMQECRLLQPTWSQLALLGTGLRMLGRLREAWTGRRMAAAAWAGVAVTAETTMGRKFIDCRAFPSEMNCSISIIADTETELVEAAVQHAVAVHGHQDTPELRNQLRSAIRDGMPSEAAPSRAA